MNLTVTTKGRQFDRLGIMYLGDIEVFRTSTSEPVPQGIIWTYVKEMDQYNTLWKVNQKIIFDLPNIVNDLYTGPLSTILTATFYTVPDERPAADAILPISAKRSAEGQGSSFTVPNDGPAIIAHTLPQNVEKAIVSLSACGQQAEEFWYENVLNSDTHAFDTSSNDSAGVLGGFSPFREVQLLIDGQLAGIAWPFPIIFTGGIAPGLWFPIAGIDAYDLRQNEIDITPWLGLLCDGKSHTFEIRVVGLDDDGAGHATISSTVGGYWIVTGTIFLFLGKDGTVTTGSEPMVGTPPPAISVSSSTTKDNTGANQTLTYSTSVKRTFSVKADISTSSGNIPASWTQNLVYNYQGHLLSKGLDQHSVQSTTGFDISSSGYSRNYAYPLTVDSSYRIPPEGGIMIDGTIDRGLSYAQIGPSVFPTGLQKSTETTVVIPIDTDVQTIQLPNTTTTFSGSSLDTTQAGSASYLSSPSQRYSFGTTVQNFAFHGVESDVELYTRHVKAVNGTVTEDDSKFIGIAIAYPVSTYNQLSISPVAAEDGNVRALLGRGPGDPKQGFAASASGVGGTNAPPTSIAPADSAIQGATEGSEQVVGPETAATS